MYVPYLSTEPVFRVRAIKRTQRGKPLKFCPQVENHCLQSPHTSWEGWPETLALGDGNQLLAEGRRGVARVAELT